MGSSIVRLAEENGRLVGFFGVMPKRFWFGGEEHSAGELVDAFIDPDFHGHGVFQRLVAEVFEACTGRLSLLYNSPNDLAKSIYIQVYRFLPAFDYVSLVRPLRLNGIPATPRWVRAVTAPPGLAAGWVFDRITLSGRSHGLSFEPMLTPDPLLDRLWADNRSRFNFSLVKNLDYLRWRFFENPEPFEVHWILRGGERIGWFVLKLNILRGLRFAHLVDYIMPWTDRAEMRTFGIRLVRWLQTRGLDWISTWVPKPSNLLQAWRGIGFFARKKHFGLMVRGQSILLPEEIQDPERWSFGQADTDNI
jgi:GNAT superfamily N-acetyltransferase